MFAFARFNALFWIALAWVLMTVSARCEEDVKENENQQTESAAEVPTEVQLAAWIVELDHPRFAQREKATEALSSAGEVAIEHLAMAMQGESLEAADRAVGVLETFARSPDQPLQLAALEVLTRADRFPTARRRADTLLAELHEQICRSRFEELGAQFKVTGPRNTLHGFTTTIEIIIDPKTWKGTPDEFSRLRCLRRVNSLKITAPMVDDDIVAQLVKINSLRQLELVHTKISVDIVKQLRKEKPELRILVRDRSMLGIRLGNGGGLLISSIELGSPAEKAGLQAGDLVQKFNGHEVDHFDTLTAHIAQHAPGESVEVTVLRADEEVTVTAILGTKDWANYPSN